MSTRKKYLPLPEETSWYIPTVRRRKKILNFKNVYNETVIFKDSSVFVGIVYCTYIIVVSRRKKIYPFQQGPH